MDTVNSKGGTYAGILVELNHDRKSDPPEWHNLKRRARYHNRPILKQILVETLQNKAGELHQNPVYFNSDFPLLQITNPLCGHSVTYRSYGEIPETDVPCPCGDKSHWFIRYRDLR